MRKPGQDRVVDSLNSSSVSIFGLGLMGGSLAMALHGKCREIIAVDPDPITVSHARKNQIVDYVTQLPDEKINRTDIIVLAAPIRKIISLLGQLPSLHDGSAIVIDLGSTKTSIIEAMRALPDRFDPIGGHPMCGKENASIAFADEELFIGAPFALIPLIKTSSTAKMLAEQIVESIGAVPLWLDAETHDAWAARTSHLPYLTSNNLAAVTPIEAAQLVGPGFKSAARLAGSQIEMMIDILITNREEIISGLNEFEGNLMEIIQALEQEDYPRLKEMLNHGENQYQKIIQMIDEGC